MKEIGVSPSIHRATQSFSMSTSSYPAHRHYSRSKNEKIIALLLCVLLTPSLGVTQENQSASSASKQSSTGEALLQEELLTLTLPSILYLYFWKCLENTLFHTSINRNFVLPEYSTEQHRNPFTEAGWPRRAHQTMHQAHLPAVLEWVVVSYFRMNANPGHKWIWNARALCLLREFLEEGLGQGQGELELDGARRFYQFSILPPFYSFPEEQLSSSAVFF